VVEIRPSLLDGAVECDQLIDRAAQLCQRVGVEAAGLEPLYHAVLAVRRHLADLAPGIGEEAERPRRRHRRILLAQRTGSGVARIDEQLAASVLLALIELQ